MEENKLIQNDRDYSIWVRKEENYIAFLFTDKRNSLTIDGYLQDGGVGAFYPYVNGKMIKLEKTNKYFAKAHAICEKLLN